MLSGREGCGGRFSLFIVFILFTPIFILGRGVVKDCRCLCRVDVFRVFLVGEMGRVETR